jgi:hypothetical protein
MAYPKETLSGQVLDAYRVVTHPSMRNIPPAAINTVVTENIEIFNTNEKHFDAQHPHMERSKRHILSTADKALARAPEGKTRKALILGAGNCLDIPLVGLAQRFDEVTLVDIDREGTEEAVREMDPALQRKMKIVVADVSGVMGEYTKIIKSAATLRSVDQFRSVVSSLSQISVANKAPDLGDDFTFVSSQLIMSQLGHFPNKYVENIVGRRYIQQLPQASNQTEIEQYAASIILARALQKEHIRYLARSVAPLGTVHLADTYTVIDNSVPNRMLRSEVVDPVIEEHFNHLEPVSNWVWNNIPGEFSFRVFAHALEPKPRV